MGHVAFIFISVKFLSSMISYKAVKEHLTQYQELFKF